MLALQSISRGFESQVKLSREKAPLCCSGYMSVMPWFGIVRRFNSDIE